MAFIIIDYQPVQVSSIRSMPSDELVFNITSVAKAAVNYFDGFNAEKAAEKVA